MAAVRTVSLAQLAPYLESQFGDALKKLNWKRIFDTIGLFMARATDKNFAESKSPDGIPWKPLKYPRRRTKGMGKANPKKGEVDRPLRDTDILMASVTNRASADHFEGISGYTWTYGTLTEYGRYHQDGAPKANIPMREFLGINDAFMDQVQAFLADEIATQLGAA